MISKKKTNLLNSYLRSKNKQNNFQLCWRTGPRFVLESHLILDDADGCTTHANYVNDPGNSCFCDIVDDVFEKHPSLLQAYTEIQV